jgi:hypothetical protein
VKIALENLKPIAQVIVPLIEKFGTKFWLALFCVGTIAYCAIEGIITSEYVVAASIVMIAAAYMFARHKQENMVIKEDKK